MSSKKGIYTFYARIMIGEIMSLTSKVLMLERKVNLISRALELSALESAEMKPAARRELRSRIMDLLKERKSKFVELKDIDAL